MTPPQPTAVVTGAGSGIGREFALALAPDTRLLLADIDEPAAARTAALVVARGGEAHAVACDVRDASAVDALARTAHDVLGHVDTLVNNAGVLVVGTVTDLSLDDYRRAIDVNLWGVIHGCRAFAPAMRRRRRGRIINVASLAGFVPLPLMGPYGATKAAVIALSESLAAELREAGVTVTVVCPSFTRTGLIDNSSGDGHDTALDRARRIMNALGDNPRAVVNKALKSARRGELYAFPNHHGTFAWRAKRLSPRAWSTALGALQILTL